MAVGVTVIGPIADAAKIVTRVGDDLVDAAGNIYKKLDGSDTFTDINCNSFQLDNNGDLVRLEVPDVSRTVTVDIAKVKKGTPEYEALNNPKPNTTTELSNGTTFKTGQGGYVDEVVYQPVDTPGIRDARQTQVGKEGIAGDVGGHIQACRHGGTCDRFNLFPQNSNFNNSAYKKWENEITKSLQNGDSVGKVKVNLNRTDPYNPRPDSIDIEYQINGRTLTREFKNEAGQ